MTLTELKYCLELSKTKNFGQAAKNCFVSQPTLSIAIKKLEQELEICIFERQNSNIIITPIGKKIIEITEKIFLDIKTIKEIVNDENEEFSEVKIGAIYTIGPYLYPSLIKQFNHDLPNIKLSIEENYTNVLTDKLHRGELDFIIIAEPFNEKNIETIFLYEEPFITVVSKQNKLKNQKSINFNQIKNETLLLLGAGHCFRDQVLEAYPQLLNTNHNSKLQKTLEGTSLETIKYTVATNNGITILPCTATQQKETLLEYIPLKNPTPTRKIVIAYRKHYSRKKLLKQVLNSLQNITLPCTKKSS